MLRGLKSHPYRIKAGGGGIFLQRIMNINVLKFTAFVMSTSKSCTLLLLKF